MSENILEREMAPLVFVCPALVEVTPFPFSPFRGHPRALSPDVDAPPAFTPLCVCVCVYVHLQRFWRAQATCTKTRTTQRNRPSITMSHSDDHKRDFGRCTCTRLFASVRLARLKSDKRACNRKKAKEGTYS